MLSVVFGFCAIANSLPLSLQYMSDVCTQDQGICDPSQTFCVSKCTWGSGSWQTVASSCIWISNAITTWLISPSNDENMLDNKGVIISRSETDDSLSDSDDIESGR